MTESTVVAVDFIVDFISTWRRGCVLVYSRASIAGETCSRTLEPHQLVVGSCVGGRIVSSIKAKHEIPIHPRMRLARKMRNRPWPTCLSKLLCTYVHRTFLDFCDDPLQVL